MVAYLISIFPVAATALLSVVITWLLCKFWYNAHYVHTQDVRPMQESQVAMQNQYSILAERIKNADQKILELNKKLQEETEAHKQAIGQIAVLEHQQAATSVGLEQGLKEELIALLEAQKAGKAEYDEAEKKRLKELINIMRQSIQEFKTDLNQKINSSSTQQTELSAQIWQLLEINKKLSEETATLSKALSSFIIAAEKSQDRPFTLTSIHKRS